MSAAKFVPAVALAQQLKRHPLKRNILLSCRSAAARRGFSTKRKSNRLGDGLMNSDAGFLNSRTARRLAAASVIVVASSILFGLAGCGSQSETISTDAEPGSTVDDSTVITDTPESGGSYTDIPSPPPEPGGPLKYVGAMTKSIESGDSPAVKVDFWVSKPITSQQGGPPDEALQACNADYSVTRAQSVYVRGKLVGTNKNEQFPQILQILAHEAVSGYFPSWGGVMSVQDDGYWGCADTAYTLDPGESESVNFWLLLGALNEQNPTLTKAVKNTWNFTIPPASPLAGTTPSGPGAADCDDWKKGPDVLMLYARPPFQYSEGSGEPVTCT